MSLFIAVISLSVGYASLSSSLLVSGEAHLRVKEEVRVTNLKILEQTSSSYDNNSEYYKNGLILRAVLPNKDSKITYTLELTNNSSVDYYLKSAGYKSIEEDVYTEIDKNTMTFVKGDFKYTITGIKTDDTVIKPNKSTFTITITYKDGLTEVPSNNNAVIDIRYEFDILDKIPPVVSFSPNGGCYGSFQTVRVTGYDEHFNHMDIEVYKNGEKIEEKTISYPNNSYDISLNEYTEYTIYVKAYDDKGNVQTILPQDNRGYTYQKYLIEDADSDYLYDKVKKCAVSDENVDFSEQPTNEEAKQAYYLNTSKSEEYPIYYYRGPVTNNNVIFAGYCWKIVRTTETGGIKLLYSGIPTSDGKCTATGEEQFAFKSQFNPSSSNKKYVGYMYGDDDNPYENKYPSTIKENLEAWFEGNTTSNMTKPTGIDSLEFNNLTQYEESFLEDAVWCNDRTEGRVYGTIQYYAAYDRNVYKPYSTSLACPSNDSFTVSSANGNGKSKHKVGLITADELTMGGMNWNTGRSGNLINTYLYIGVSNAYWWTLSPYTWDDGKAFVFRVNDILQNSYATTSHGVRPMVSLVHDTKVVGSGTSEDPYKVPETLYDKMISSATEIVSDEGLDFSQQPTDEEATKLYQYSGETSEPGDNPIYYYRGPVTNNNVIFGGYCWKIVRTTETGGIKLLYSGIPTSDGKCTTIGEEEFAFKSQFNSEYSIRTSVGYMYGEYDNPYENTYDSIVKKNIEAWFEGKSTNEDGNLDGSFNPDYIDLTKYEESFLEDAVWCNDRSVFRSAQYYAVYDRNNTFSNFFRPSLSCPSNDSFTKSIKNGNGKLKHKVGLITADELTMGGLNNRTSSSNINTYLYTGSSTMWWSLSPAWWETNGTRVFTVKDSLSVDIVLRSYGVRPMVSLQHEVKVVGSGTGDDPYKVVDPYSESTLNGADPELGSGMIPVTIDNNGIVKYANVQEKWYSYKDKEWANAVILVDKPSKSYNVGDIISESDIESYFVWIPRYRYQLWDLGDYTGYINGQPDKSNARTIQIKFETIGNETKDGVSGECSTPLESGGKGSCNVGDWMTHPAFINMNTNGLWVGKFETGYNQNSDPTTPITDTSTWTRNNVQKNEQSPNKVIVKPNVYSWQNITIKNMFYTSYNYNRDLDSHMMKNTEWGAVAYLSHSNYGIGKEVNINNNSQFKTGYSATSNTDQSGYNGTTGTTDDVTQPYNTKDGYLASTTENITGVYDMSGGTWEYMAASILNNPGESELTLEEINKYRNYFDLYYENSSIGTFKYRILGDATGELGPFFYRKDLTTSFAIYNSWYTDVAQFLTIDVPAIVRGGINYHGVTAGQFHFAYASGEAYSDRSFRLVLAVR